MDTALKRSPRGLRPSVLTAVVLLLSLVFTFRRAPVLYQPRVPRSNNYPSHDELASVSSTCGVERLLKAFSKTLSSSLAVLQPSNIMHIQEVIIEGFKSYAQRTVIQGWDPQFNAITGLNGSGKSNILDAICFVLGITNLSQVRAGNLQDLVYKQGQAGVTKASVTIVFNNADSATSPIGYEHQETISVCRQVRNVQGKKGE
jgi:hypothetical protein